MSEPLLDVFADLAKKVVREYNRQIGEARVRELEREVRAYLAENPGASANAVAAAIGGRRKEVLRLVREARGSP